MLHYLLQMIQFAILKKNDFKKMLNAIFIIDKRKTPQTISVRQYLLIIIEIFVTHVTENFVIINSICLCILFTKTLRFN